MTNEEFGLGVVKSGQRMLWQQELKKGKGLSGEEMARRLLNLSHSKNGFYFLILFESLI